MGRIVTAPFLLPTLLWTALWAETPESPPPRSWGVKEGLLMYLVWIIVSVLTIPIEAALSKATLWEVLASTDWFDGDLAAKVAALAFGWHCLRRRGVGLVEFGFRPFDAERFFRLLAAGLMSILCLVPILFAVVWLVVPGFDAKEPYLPELEAAVEAGGGKGMLALALAAVVGPLFEEVACRGFLFTALAGRGVGRAALLSTVVFALAHVQPNAMVNAFLIGLVMCALYWKLGSLWPTLVMHGFFNAFLMLA